MERRLSAILAVDVVGYSRLMEINEVATLAAFKNHRSQLIEPLISQHHGRIVKLTGDGMLVEFPSVVNAVDCAAGIQREMRQRNADVPHEQRIEFRMGINLGDVIVDGDDLFGDGVNIAARVESLAPPGGIAVTGWVKESIGNNLQLEFEDTGEQTLKNIGRLVRIYNVVLDAGSSPMTRMTIPAAAHWKTGIAVLPFSTMGSSTEQDYLAEGISEDIITELSRFRNLRVIARNSSFSFKSKDIDGGAAARMLNVEYIATGSVRRSRSRVRVAVQLTHAPSGGEVWAERYDRELTDIFAVQDEVVRTIVVTLEARLGLAIADSARSRNMPSLAAYECLLLARKYVTAHEAERAMPLVERALSLDPDHSLTHSMLSAICYVRWLADPRDEYLDGMEAAARRAVALDNGDSKAHAYLGMALTYRKRFELAGSHLQRAISLNPGDTHAMGYYSEWLLRIGKAEAALAMLDELLERDPIPPTWYWEVRGLVLLLLGRYVDALQAYSRQYKQFWYIHGYLAICLVRLGRTEEARSEIEAALSVMPDPQAVRYQLVDEFEDPEYRKFIDEGLTLAGLPK
ncbi:tetratricopeptide repeat protein [Geminicoccus harenae]|uniref:tetratricopeptide repeat protein n=1 Tax=Geminicoccus harenae TaxID=2498453 RepID=UPI00168B647A|nr:adenylate/guanylate cyclase domain-containing protein [Geminicoccus harenae]